MTLTETILKRRSVRKFEPRPVPRETLERLLALTLTAPSSRSVRSSRFIVVDRPELVSEMAVMRDYGAAFLKDTPCAVVVLGEAGTTDLWVDNAAISATFLQLAAEEAGLGSCWVHVNGRPRVRGEADGEKAADFLARLLSIPEGWKPLCIIALGYPAASPKPHEPDIDNDKVIWL